MATSIQPETVSRAAARLPAGVKLVALTRHPDDRGVFTEIFRDEWRVGERPVQWNVVRSEANALRGVHVHLKHSDVITVPFGRMLLGLKDLRPGAATHGLSAMVELSVEAPALAYVPVGVAHGFYFPEPSLHVYGVSEAFDGSDEFGCRWDDPALGLDWPCADPLLSERDAKAQSLTDLTRQIGAGLERCL